MFGASKSTDPWARLFISLGLIFELFSTESLWAR
jgi:hypothetical protein